MKCTFIKDDRCEVVIHAKEKTHLTEEIERLCRFDGCELVGYTDRDTVILEPYDICCFTVEDNRVYARTDRGIYQVKQRLYQLEESMGKGFVKINQSCIANIKRIDRFEATFGGSLAVIFKNGYRDYVSRRQTKHVKERLGLK